MLITHRDFRYLEAFRRNRGGFENVCAGRVGVLTECLGEVDGEDDMVL